MTLLFRLLGATARINQVLSRTRINFIPLNWAAMFGLGCLFIVGCAETLDAVVNGDKPRVATIAEVLDHKDSERNYVTVKGELHPEVGFQKVVKGKYSSSERQEEAYVPMLDAAARRALVIERPENDFDHAKGGETEITGMLVSLPTDISTKLQENGGKIGGVPVDTSYMLQEGHAPGNAGVWGTVTLVSGILLAAFVFTFFTRYVVFQKTGREAPTIPQTAIDPQQGIDLRVTGRFVLDERTAQRFLNVPAGLAQLDTGEMALISNIDASPRFFGITTSKRAGLWAILLQPGSLNKIEAGRLYDGLAMRPAFRIHYREGGTNQEATSILSFANEAERESILTDLNKLAGYSLSVS